MKKILILGAGLVAKPMIDYFLSNNYLITVVDIDDEKAKKLIQGNPHGTALIIDIGSESKKLDELVADHDITINILPPHFMPIIAKVCIAKKKNLIGTNYVSQEIQDLDADAREAGITIIDEVGVDPGIDHMIAKKVIDDVHAIGGKVVSFKSYCGGLPAPDSNKNPFGYKFSWSPRGALLASKRDAHFKENNRKISISADKLFSKENISYLQADEDIGKLEVYANHDSLKYIDLYDIPEVETIFRSTLRYPGWAETIKALVDLNYLSLEQFDADCTYSTFLANLIHTPNNNITNEVAQFLKIKETSEILSKLDWLGLFSNDQLLCDCKKISPIDLLTNVMLEKMSYKHNERDLLVLINEFIIKYQDSRQEIIKTTLKEYGTKNNYSAMAKTVSYPVITITELLLAGRIKEKGVIRPISREIYEPVLERLQRFGLKIKSVKRAL